MVEPTASSVAPYAPRNRAIACSKCHSRRVKCSGGKPCTNCRRADKSAECVYPQKDRLVKVSQQYVDDLIAENSRLQQRTSQAGRQPASRTDVGETGIESEHQSTTPVPELASAPWFISFAGPHTPILLAEASDSAFATRCRQVMSGSDHSHLPRVNYPAEDLLLALSDAHCAWPSPSQARLLVSAAMKNLGRSHHIVRNSVILEELEQSLQHPRSVGGLRQSKFWVLFAIGKLYLTRTPSSPENFPGLEYFAKAIKILHVIVERPTVEMVETWLLLSFYSLCLNRRHSAYTLAGSAVRVAIIMGLHMNAPEHLLPDPETREHRIRVFWTAYTFDRMWATKTGYPVGIEDSDIDVDLPSNKVSSSDFVDCDYSVAMIELTTISGRILNSIYGKRSQQTSLSQRVHDNLSDLRQWLKQLPTSLQMDQSPKAEAGHEAESLQLLFNQLVMLATRPVLLHVLRTRLKTSETGETYEIPGSASALSEACVRCARQSFQILTGSWISGAVMMYDYFYAQYLFTVANVLAVSSLIDDNESQPDRESFETARQFLAQLNDSGNFVAAEFKQHVDAMKLLLPSAERDMRHGGGEETRGGNAEPLAAVQDLATTAVLSEPLFQDLLAQQVTGFEFIDASMSMDAEQGLYWPMTSYSSEQKTMY